MSVVKTVQDAGAADEIVQRDVKGERSLGSNDITSDPYFTHRWVMQRNSFP